MIPNKPALSGLVHGVTQDLFRLEKHSLTKNVITIKEVYNFLLLDPMMHCGFHCHRIQPIEMVGTQGFFRQMSC